LTAQGVPVTPVVDRTYFRSIYFRETGGVLMEIATDAPGFTVDEPIPELGRRLMLPSRYEPLRAELERTLPPLGRRPAEAVPAGEEVPRGDG
jgi:glyoxalase family protein